MEVDSMPFSVPLGVNTSQEESWVLCAQCGQQIAPNNAGLCLPCLRNSVDISESIPKQASVNFCKGCNRYLSPPQTWLLAELESRELLAICLRKLKGLKEVRLIDAGFIWTEPHSKRLRLKLTIQKEVLSGTVLQQVFEIEFIVQYCQCPECARLAAKNTWRALVQVRQKVNHKRTFLYLEQLILKHGADKDTISIKEVKDGLDFFYASRQHAAKMVDFLTAVAPVRVKTSEQLISIDTQNSTTNYKSTWSVEIIPVCKDDLVCLPRKLANSLSNIGQLTICTRVGNSLHLMDPTTLSQAEITTPAYWRTPFSALAASPAGCIEFMVLDIEPSSHPPKTANRGRSLLADAQVTPTASNMDSDAIFHTRTHLGAILKPGDTVLGYLLTSSNFNSNAWEELDPSKVPQVVLVRKTYPERRKKSKPRPWRLKTMAKEVDQEGDHAGLGRAKGGSGKKGGMSVEQQRAEADYEMFVRDIEEDAELRQAINLYKARPKRADPNEMEVESETASVAGTELDDDFPQIHMNELLDEMTELAIAEEDETAGDSESEA